MAFSIRVLTEADLDVAHDIARQAYDSTTNYRASLRRHIALQPDGWILACLDGEPAGLVGAINYGPFAYVGTMSVLPKLQRRGIGHALMEHLLVWLRWQRCPTVLLDATGVGAALYTRFAFVDDDTTTHWVRSAQSLLPQKGAVALSPVTECALRDLPQLTAFDTPYFGAGRASVFAQLMDEFPGRVFVTRDGTGRISGYLFAQSRNIGPWVTATREDAEALLMHALTLPFDEESVVLTSSANTLASELLTQYGFERRRVLRHMRYGQPALLRKRALIYGQVNFALG